MDVEPVTAALAGQVDVTFAVVTTAIEFGESCLMSGVFALAELDTDLEPLDIQLCLRLHGRAHKTGMTYNRLRQHRK